MNEFGGSRGPTGPQRLDHFADQGGVDVGNGQGTEHRAGVLAKRGQPLPHMTRDCASRPYALHDTHRRIGQSVMLLGGRKPRRLLLAPLGCEGIDAIMQLKPQCLSALARFRQRNSVRRP